MKKILLIIGIFFSVSILWNVEVNAQVIINKEYSREYSVNDDSISVQESKKIRITQSNWYINQGAEEVFTIFNPVKNDPDRDIKLQRTIDSIEVFDNLGFRPAYTTEFTDGGNIILRVRFPVRIDSFRDYILYLNYTSYGLIVKSGKLRDVYVPAFSSEYRFVTETTSEEVFTRVIVPNDFGQINFATPDNRITEDGSNRIITFQKESLVGETGWIQVGVEQYYEFKITQPVKSTTGAGFFQNKYRVLIPRDIKSGPISQKVFYTNISPAPTNSFIDKDGNTFLEFSFLGNVDGEIIIEGYSILTQDNTIQYRDSGTLSQIPEEILRENTSPARFWESNSPEIIEVADILKSQVRGEDKSVYELIANTYRYVIDKIDYSEVKRFGINERQGALATLLGGAAVCMEYSDLFIALMRAQGIPARGAFGYGYSALDVDEQEDTINHQWAEVYIPSIGEWVAVDTTWGENGDELIGGDLNHFYTHVASISPEVPSTTEVEFYGRLNTVPEKTMTVVATENIPSEQGRSVEEVYSQYKSEDSESWITNSFTRIRLVLFEIDSFLNDLIKNLIPQISDLGLTLIKSAPFILLFTIVIFRLIIKIRKVTKKRYAEPIYKPEQ